jgi:endonuclease-3
MKRAEKAAQIVSLLEDLYPSTPVPLDHNDPYTLLVAVMLSAQTTDKKVNQVTPGLFARARTPEAMARLEVEEIRGLIREIGLAPTKAKNLKRMGELLVSEFGGVVPATYAGLESLPGVGHKTASVVMSQAFGFPAFPVDTHIHRLAIRWGLTEGKNVVQTERDLKRIFAETLWNKLHLQIIFFGREHCPALRHDLDGCPICGWAASKKIHRAEALKGRSKAKRP